MFLKKSWRKIYSDKRGLSLIETMVAVGIFVLIMSGMIGMISFGFRSRDVTWEQMLTQSEGRRVVQDFVNELRSANQSSIGAYPIEKAEANQLVFFSNIDSDSYRERIRYFLSGTDFKKGVTKPSGNPLKYNTSTESIIVIAHDVVNSSTPVFKYFTQSFSGSQSAMSSPVTTTLVRVVEVTLTMEENPRLSPAPFVVQAKAQIRNLKSN